MRRGNVHRSTLPLNTTEHVPEVFAEGNVRPYNIGYALILTLYGTVSLQPT
jgi:hypothetical protein